MKYLIVGLGNPGSEYQHTRHNIGFKILDELAGSFSVSFDPGRYADVAEAKWKGRKLLLIKPTTFMNLSGKAVNYWMQQEKIDPKNILIVTDDIALPFGALRMKGKGSDGGHNGLKSIQELIGTTAYPRLRFGVGNDFHKGQQVSYVLGEWSDEQKDHLPERMKQACEMIKAFTTIGLSLTMNQYNNK